MATLKIVSLFSGCGGLDLGFTRAGFELVYANDNDPAIWETFEKNHKISIDHRSLFDIKSEEIPDADGIVGGPPCQSWSLAGEMRGVKDERGQLFYEYIRVLKDKKPKFFLAENVPGIISCTHLPEFNKIINKFAKLGYEITPPQVLNAKNYGVPQERRRVIVVGYHKSLKKHFTYPPITHTKDGNKRLDSGRTEKWLTLEKAIGDLPVPMAAKDKNKANENLAIPNHEYMNGGFSSIYMSRNRRKNLEDQSYTIQAGGRHAPLHPCAPKMEKVETDKWQFVGNEEVRRLSVREAARIQTFPDEFIFYYKNIGDGYKMVGNAVPVKLAEALANKIKLDISAI